MANNVTNTLAAVITSTEDTTGNVPINRGTGNPAFDSVSGDFRTYLSITGALVLTPNPNPARQVYIRNLDATNDLTIAWVPSGGVNNTVILLKPGEQIMFWGDPSKAGGGVTQITITPSATPCLLEYFIGG